MIPPSFMLRWTSVAVDSYQIPYSPENGGDWRSKPPFTGTGFTSSLAHRVAEYYTGPIPVPVGAEMYRITPGAEEFIARFDGQVWLRPSGGIWGMRYRLMATYQGVHYEAGIGPSEGDVVLFAACPPPEELGFEPATGHWRKQLRLQDVQEVWESRPMGLYRGQRCLVLDDLGDRLHIAYLGHDAYQAQQLGYWEVDRGVFELVTPRDEVTEVTEERFDYPESSGTAGSAGQAGGPAAAADYDPATA